MKPFGPSHAQVVADPPVSFNWIVFPSQIGELLVELQASPDPTLTDALSLLDVVFSIV